MTEKIEQVYQFKITLEDSKPAIWRRIQVLEGYTFWDLHVAIQDSMGWFDSHLHQFQIRDPKSGKQVSIGRPDATSVEVVLPDWKIPIANYFTLKNKQAIYEYDFGDDWRHEVLLEKILPVEPTQKYPCCLDGKRACPPEDCGGIYGYENLIEVMNDPTHEEYESMLKWLGKKLTPEKFNIKKVHFTNPKIRFKEASSMGMI